MRWNRVPPADVVALVDSLVNLPWPVPEKDVDARLAELGITPYAPGMVQTYRAGLPVEPDLVSTVIVDGTLWSIEAGLTDDSDETGTERDDFQSAAFVAYSMALQDRFGPARPGPFPRKYDEMIWDLEEGPRIVLQTGIEFSTVEVYSPEAAEVKRDLRGFESKSRDKGEADV